MKNETIIFFVAALAFTLNRLATCEEHTAEDIKETMDAPIEEIKAAFSSPSDYVSGKIHKIEHLYADTKDALTERVDGTVRFLNVVNEHQKHMLKDAAANGNLKLQHGLENIEAMLKDARLFQQTLYDDSTDTFAEQQTSWKLKAAQLWNSGLENLAEYASRLRDKTAQFKEDL